MNALLSVEIREDLKASLLKFVQHEIEEKYSVKVLFLAETGSRGYHTHTRESDMDVKGFYVYKEQDYIQVVDKTKIISKTKKQLSLADGSSMEFDYTFIEIRKYLKRKVVGRKVDQINLWVHSECVYLNRFPEEIFQNMRNIFKLPYVALNGHLKTFIKMFKNKEDIPAKDMLNSIVNGCMLLKMMIARSQPIYHTWKQMEELIKIKEKLEEKKKEEEKITSDGSADNVIPESLQQINAIQAIAVQLFEIKTAGKKGVASKEHIATVIPWIQSVIGQHSALSGSEISNEYFDTPEITLAAADVLFHQIIQLNNDMTITTDTAANV